MVFFKKLLATNLSSSLSLIAVPDFTRKTLWLLAASSRWPRTGGAVRIRRAIHVAGGAG